MSLGQRQFANQVNRVQQERGNGNWDAFMTVAAAVSSRNATTVDQPIIDHQMSSRITEFAVNTDAEQVQVKFRDQFERMKKHGVLKLA